MLGQSSTASQEDQRHNARPWTGPGSPSLDSAGYVLLSRQLLWPCHRVGSRSPRSRHGRSLLANTPLNRGVDKNPPIPCLWQLVIRITAWSPRPRNWVPEVRPEKHLLLGNALSLCSATGTYACRTSMCNLLAILTSGKPRVPGC